MTDIASITQTNKNTWAKKKGTRYQSPKYDGRLSDIQITNLKAKLHDMCI